MEKPSDVPPGYEIYQWTTGEHGRGVAMYDVRYSGRRVAGPFGVEKTAIEAAREHAAAVRPQHELAGVAVESAVPGGNVAASAALRPRLLTSWTGREHFVVLGDTVMWYGVDKHNADRYIEALGGVA